MAAALFGRSTRCRACRARGRRLRRRLCRRRRDGDGGRDRRRRQSPRRRRRGRRRALRHPFPSGPMRTVRRSGRRFAATPQIKPVQIVPTIPRRLRLFVARLPPRSRQSVRACDDQSAARQELGARARETAQSTEEGRLAVFPHPVAKGRGFRSQFLARSLQVVGPTYLGRVRRRGLRSVSDDAPRQKRRQQDRAPSRSLPHVASPSAAVRRHNTATGEDVPQTDRAPPIGWRRRPAGRRRSPGGDSPWHGSRRIATPWLEATRRPSATGRGTAPPSAARRPAGLRSVRSSDRPTPADAGGGDALAGHTLPLRRPKTSRRRPQRRRWFTRAGPSSRRCSSARP